MRPLLRPVLLVTAALVLAVAVTLGATGLLGGTRLGATTSRPPPPRAPPAAAAPAPRPGRRRRRLAGRPGRHPAGPAAAHARRTTAPGPPCRWPTSSRPGSRPTPPTTPRPTRPWPGPPRWRRDDSVMLTARATLAAARHDFTAGAARDRRRAADQPVQRRRRGHPLRRAHRARPLPRGAAGRAPRRRPRPRPVDLRPALLPGRAARRPGRRHPADAPVAAGVRHQRVVLRVRHLPPRRAGPRGRQARTGRPPLPQRAGRRADVPPGAGRPGPPRRRARRPGHRRARLPARRAGPPPHRVRRGAGRAVRGDRASGAGRPAVRRGDRVGARWPRPTGWPPTSRPRCSRPTTAAPRWRWPPRGPSGTAGTRSTPPTPSAGRCTRPARTGPRWALPDRPTGWHPGRAAALPPRRDRGGPAAALGGRPPAGRAPARRRRQPRGARPPSARCWAVPDEPAGCARGGGRRRGARAAGRRTGCRERAPAGQLHGQPLQRRRGVAGVGDGRPRARHRRDPDRAAQPGDRHLRRRRAVPGRAGLVGGDAPAPTRPGRCG